MKSGNSKAPPGLVGVTLARLVRRHGLLALLSGALAALTVVLFEAVSASLGDLAPIWFVSFIGAAAPASLLGVWVVVSRVSRGGASEKHQAARILSLPEQLGVVHMSCWTIAGTSAAVVLGVLDSFRLDRSLMLLLIGVLAGTGSALVALVWSRRVLEGIWTWAVNQVRGDLVLQKKVHNPLRRQMALFLGGLVFFSSGLALYTSFALQREVVSYYIEQQGDVVAKRWSQGGFDSAPPTCEELQPLVPVDGALVATIGGRTCSLGTPLDEETLRALKTSNGRYLAVPSERLEGIRIPVDDGSLAVLVQKPEWARRVLLVSLFFFTLLYILSSWLASQIARSLTRPIVQLTTAVKGIEGGDLDSKVEVTSPDELGDLSGSMESMRLSLNEMIETVRALNLSLEDKVVERTSQLQDANKNLQQAMDNLKATQAQLVHAEKMAGLGRMMSGLAHELNNPINAIVNSVGPMKKGLEQLNDEFTPKTLARIEKASRIIEHASSRTVSIIESLANFSRSQEQVARKVSLKEQAEATLLLLQHRVDAQGTDVLRRYGEVPDVMGHAGELGQVMMNLLANALDAVEPLKSEGRIELSTTVEGDSVAFWVSNNGPTITPDTLERIFEPFFTTRDRGIGLGLAISHEIMVRHGGQLEAFSAPAESSKGLATRFAMRLPVDSPVSLD